MEFFSKKFWDSVLCKMIANLISIKVWVIIGAFFIASWVIKIAIEFQQWSLVSTAITMVTTVIGIVVVMRAGFKISSLKNGSKKEETNINA